MSRHWMLYLVALAVIVLARPSAAFAADGDVTAYDTVDALQVIALDTVIQVTGIIAGQSAPTTTSYRVGTSSGPSAGARCDRLALLAMSKPGKWQFAVIDVESGILFECRLTLRAP